jgi:hypothetical protein
MSSDEDLVARRVLRVERDELLEERQRVALRARPIKALVLLRCGCADANDDDERDGSEGQRAKGKG